MLLAWSRREHYPLGFGPFPIVFSTNLFLWFKDDWFSLQFVLIAVGFLGKAFVRWERDGRRVHIFNPSAFTLALFSLVLLATGTTTLTWGQEIATTFSLGPRIYMVLFLIGLVVMYFFAITPVTAAAAATLFGASALYARDDRRAVLRRLRDSVGGVPRAAPAGHRSVDVAAHAARAARSSACSTALGVFALYALLGALGLPTFYDKLLCVPLLNLAVPAIDRCVRRSASGRSCTRLGLDGPLGRGNLAHMAVWVAVLRRDDRARRHRRHASRRFAAVLAAGLRRESAAGVRSGC